MKWIFLLFLLFLVIAMFFTKYRKQINAAIYLWKKVQNQDSLNKQADNNQIGEINDSKETPLTKCVMCGTWTPLNTAVNLKNKVYCCSNECIEKALVLN